MSKNGTHVSPTEVEEVENTFLLKKRIDAEDMNQLLKVHLLGGGSVEAAKKKRAAPETETSDGTEDGAGGDKSQQLDDFQQYATGEFIPPKYNPTIWAMALTQNTRLARCIRSYARNTVGLGWKIEPIHPITPETPKAERTAIEEQMEVLRAFFNYPNEKMPFTEVANLMKIDEESVGNGYWEVVRNAAGGISKLYHVPSTTMRRRLIDRKSVV